MGCGPDSVDTGGDGDGTGEMIPQTSEDGSSGEMVPQASEDSASSGNDTAGLGGVCGGELSDSWVAWEAARDASANTYVFTMWETFGDRWGGPACSDGSDIVACSGLTTLTVVDGVVVGRALETTPESPGAEPEDCPAPYDESGDALGSHIDGYAVSTLDEVYERCCDLAQMHGRYHTGFEGDNTDVFVKIGDDTLLRVCMTGYEDGCSSSGPSEMVVGSVALGE